MRKLIISEFISLDGVIQAPGGADEDTDGGFAHGGWTWNYWHDDLGAHFAAAMAESDTMLLGRKTWQTHGEAFNPMPEDDPFAGVLNKAKKYVVSTTLTNTDTWRNSEIISENVVERIRELKAQPGKNIMLDGSSVLAHTLIEHDLVDEFYLLVYPLVLGSGKKLFPDGLRVNLRLVEARPVPSGVIITHYQRDIPAE